MTKPKRPGRIPLRLALIFGVLGLALVVTGSVLLATGLLNKINGFTRVSLAQSPATVQLERTGKYVGYFETPDNASHRATVNASVTDPSHRPVTLTRYGRNTSLTYSHGGRYGQALFTFTIARPGRYIVSVRSTNAPQGAGVALGQSIAGGLVTGVAMIVPGALLIVVAIVLLIVGIVRRTSFNKREREMAARPQWGYQ